VCNLDLWTLYKKTQPLRSDDRNDTNLCYLEVGIIGQGLVPQIWAQKRRLRLDIPDVALLLVFVIWADDFFAIRCGFACKKKMGGQLVRAI